MDQSLIEMACKTFHGIGGVLPQKMDIHFDGKTCDCGKLLFYAEMCGCPSNKHLELYSKENPNYIPKDF